MLANWPMYKTLPTITACIKNSACIMRLNKVSAIKMDTLLGCDCCEEFDRPVFKVHSAIS